MQGSVAGHPARGCGGSVGQGLERVGSLRLPLTAVCGVSGRPLPFAATARQLALFRDAVPVQTHEPCDFQTFLL